MKKVYIFGSSGQLGTEIKKKIKKKFKIVNFNQRLDLTNSKHLNFLKKIKLDYVINCAAVHDLNFCEKNIIKCFEVNTFSMEELSKICAQRNITLIHISTDYVYNNFKKNYNKELDAISPINTYGLSKLSGENLIKKNLKNYLIFRVASLFGSTPPSGKKGNFVDTIVSKIKNNENLKIVGDQHMSPTWTYDIACNILKIMLSKKIKYGTYNLSCKNSCTWYEFGGEIVKNLKSKTKIKKIKYNDLNYDVQRPLNSKLNVNKFERTFNIKLPEWKNSLKNYMKEKKYI